ncbi:MAG: hypothetical protein JWM37_797 [Candidatus Saccharibacteria bacterium]|nr:hypothetical protein [Candidatus Saccharibacteria bacterium]
MSASLLDYETAAPLRALTESFPYTDLCPDGDDLHDDQFARDLRTVADADMLECREVSAPGDDYVRHATLYDVAIGGARMLIERTRAPIGPHRQNLVFFPGLSEHITHSTVRKFHDQLSSHFPEADVTTIGSNGIGVRGHDTSTRHERNQQRLDLLLATAARQAVTTVGTSMGSQESNDLAQLNDDEGRPLVIEGQVYFASALVESCRTWRTMGSRFTPRLTYDLGRMLLRQPVNRWPEQASALAAWLKQAVIEVPSEAHQIGHLLEGTPEAQLDSVADQGFPILILNGLKDVVCEEKGMRRLARNHSNVRFVAIPKRGHDLPFEADKPADKLSREMQISGMLTPSL